MEIKQFLLKLIIWGSGFPQSFGFLPCKMEVHSPVVDVGRLAQCPKSGWWIF